MVQIYRAARWPKVPCFRQATPELNEAIEQKKFKKIKAESGSSELKNLLDLANNETDIFICEVSVCQYYLLNDPETHAIKDKIDYINKNIENCYLRVNIFDNYGNDIEQFLKNQEHINKLCDQKYKDKLLLKIIQIIDI